MPAPISISRAATGAPFFSIIMTTSNHSPYTFPVGIDGVRPHGGSRLDGIRYADYALGEFFEKSKNAPWYENTLFVVVADHGARVYGSERIPLQSYEIPLLIMAPGHIQPQQVASPISQMDIAPTVLGLLGLPYQAPFFGQNMFAANEQSRVLLFNHNHDVALYQDGKLAVLGLNNSLHTYRYRLGEDRLEEIANDNPSQTLPPPIIKQPSTSSLNMLICEMVRLGPGYRVKSFSDCHRISASLSNRCGTGWVGTAAA